MQIVAAQLRAQVSRLVASTFPRVVRIDVEGYDNRILVGGPPSLDARSLRAAVADSPVLRPSLATLQFRRVRI